MENYYFHDGLDKFGPYTLDELKKKTLNAKTPVWKDGMKEWATAGDFEELRSVVTPIPPPFKKISGTERVGRSIGRNIGWTAVVLAILFLAGWNFVSTHSPKPYLSFAPTGDQERLNPASFLSASGTYKPNFWFTKWQISGNVSNFASHTNYKDVMVRLNFYSRTNTVIGTKDYVLYDYFPYGLKKGFSLEVDKPAAAATCGLQALGAKVY